MSPRYLQDYVDLFAGPGGWDAAARALGLDGVGIELDPSACETRRAAGLRTVQGSVLDHRPRAFRARGLIGSPPCQTFSTAGSGVGRQALGAVLALAELVAAGSNPSELGWDGDPRTVLVLEPLWWAVQAMAEGFPFQWIALEQVPPVLPVWERFAVHLRAMGYAVAVGVLNAEAYGVPQTRRRAVLVARLGQPVALPTHTHSRYYPRTPDKLDPGVPRWVSMAEALGFGMTARPSTTLVTGVGVGHTGGADPLDGGSGTRAIQPAATVTSKAGRNQWQAMGDVRSSHGAVRPIDTPAPSLTSSMDNGNFRFTDHSPASRRVTVEEATTLQTFPDNYPWRGTKTKQFEQVGNAIPPQLAWHILGAVAL